MFVADWCSFCKEAKPSVFELMRKYHTNGNIFLVLDTQDNYKELSTKLNSTMFPAFVIADENDNFVKSHEGPRDYATLENFYLSNTGTDASE
jgi:thiol-disulfide isomerase/thioredoxin